MRLRLALALAAWLMACHGDDGSPLHEGGVPARDGGTPDADACTPPALVRQCDVPCPVTPEVDASGCPEQPLMPRCDDGYWSVPALLSCTPELQGASCDPRGNWSITHERVVDPDAELDAGGSSSFCFGIPSEWELVIEQLPGGALQLRFLGQGEWRSIDVAQASFDPEHCRIGLRARSTEGKSEAVFVTLDLVLELSGDGGTGTGTLSYGSLGCGGEAPLHAKAVRTAR